MFGLTIVRTQTLTRLRDQRDMADDQLAKCSKQLDQTERELTAQREQNERTAALCARQHAHLHAIHTALSRLPENMRRRLVRRSNQIQAAQTPDPVRKGAPK